MKPPIDNVTAVAAFIGERRFTDRDVLAMQVLLDWMAERPSVTADEFDRGAKLGMALVEAERALRSGEAGDTGLILDDFVRRRESARQPEAGQR